MTEQVFPNTLVIDCGNSQAKFGLGRSGQLVHRFTLDNTTIMAPEAANLITTQCAPYDIYQINKVMIASVVPLVLQRLQTIIPQCCNAKIGIVDHAHCGGMAVNVDNPEEVGADRLVNAYTARTLFGPQQIVIDFGTATTFDIVDQAGDYAGGMILPGLELSLQTLHQATALLPLVSITRAKRVMGKNTIEAINQGLYWGYIAMLEGLVDRLEQESGYKSRVIVTGGYASLWQKDCRCIDQIFADLTLVGLLHLAEIELME